LSFYWPLNTQAYSIVSQDAKIVEYNGIDDGQQLQPVTKI